jgi:hypothetical protein
MASTEDKVASVAMAIYTLFGTPYGSEFAGHLALLSTEIAKVAVDTLENLPE